MGKRKNDTVQRCGGFRTRMPTLSHENSLTRCVQNPRSSFGDDVEEKEQKRPRGPPRRVPRKVRREVWSSDETEWEVEEEEMEVRASERPRRKLRKIQHDAWSSDEDEADEDEADEKADADADEEWTPASFGPEEEMVARGRRRKRRKYQVVAWVSKKVKDARDEEWEEDEEWEGEKGETRARPRKIRRHAWSEQRRSAAVERWFNILRTATKFKETKGHFPRCKKGDQDETNLYYWLYNYRKGGRKFKQDLWELLNEAFGEGWEAEAFRSHSIKPSSKPPRGMDEATWDATLKLVIEIKRDTGAFPSAKGKEKEERRLWNWLKNNTNTGHHIYSEERARKLVLAFGKRWQEECFPNTIFVW